MPAHDMSDKQKTIESSIENATMVKYKVVFGFVIAIGKVAEYKYFCHRDLNIVFYDRYVRIYLYIEENIV